MLVSGFWDIYKFDKDVSQYLIKWPTGAVCSEVLSPDYWVMVDTITNQRKTFCAENGNIENCL